MMGIEQTRLLISLADFPYHIKVIIVGSLNLLPRCYSLQIVSLPVGGH